MSYENTIFKLAMLKTCNLSQHAKRDVLRGGTMVNASFDFMYRERWDEIQIRISRVAMLSSDCVENFDILDGCLTCPFHFALRS